MGVRSVEMIEWQIGMLGVVALHAVWVISFMFLMWRMHSRLEALEQDWKARTEETFMLSSDGEELQDYVRIED